MWRGREVEILLLKIRIIAGKFKTQSLFVSAAFTFDLGHLHICTG